MLKSVFTEFYRVLIETRNFSEAIIALQEAVGVNKEIYNYVNCEAYFDMLIKDYWKTPNEGSGAMIKNIKYATEYYFKGHPNPPISKRQVRKMIERMVVSGRIEGNLLAEMREVFLHKRHAR